MATIRILVRRLVQEDNGVAMIEYALLAALISLAAVSAISGVGTAVNAKFTRVANVLNRPQ